MPLICSSLYLRSRSRSSFSSFLPFTACGMCSHVWSYDRVVASVRQLEHNGLKYARVGLTDATQGAVFHALATKYVLSCSELATSHIHFITGNHHDIQPFPRSDAHAPHPPPSPPPHLRPARRLDGVVVLVDGCGSAVDRWLSDGGIAVIRAAGRAHFLPIVVELPGDSSGRCLPTSSPQVMI